MLDLCFLFGGISEVVFEVYCLCVCVFVLLFFKVSDLNLWELRLFLSGSHFLKGLFGVFLLPIFRVIFG